MKFSKSVGANPQHPPHCVLPMRKARLGVVGYHTVPYVDRGRMLYTPLAVREDGLCGMRLPDPIYPDLGRG